MYTNFTDFEDSVDFDVFLDELANGDDATFISDCSREIFESSSTDGSSEPGDSEFSSSISKRKKRILSDELAVAPRPRILRSDIRRSYSTMFLNVMNVGDFPTLFGFFDTFFVPDVQLQMTKKHEMVNTPDHTLTYKTTGPAAASRFWYSNVCSMPDRAITGVSAKIITPTNGVGSRIVATYEFVGTQILADLPHDFIQSSMPTGEQLESLILSKKRNIHEDEDSKRFVMKDIMSSVENMICRLPLRQTPVAIVAKGKLTFYLDDDKRITRMVVEGNQADQAN